MAICPSCGTPLPDGAGCPRCPVVAAPCATAVPVTDTVGLTDNSAAALAYLTPIPAIVFLVVEPFRRKRFVRFHALQSIFFFLGWIAIDICLAIIGHIPFLGWATLLLWPLVSLALFLVLLMLALKAYQGEKFQLPLIGEIAEQQAGVQP